jgi:Transposase IS116/IS110/IS902 family
LTDLHGVGPLVAARFIAEVVDVRRCPSPNAFAAARGTALLPASDHPAPLQPQQAETSAQIQALTSPTPTGWVPADANEARLTA